MTINGTSGNDSLVGTTGDDVVAPGLGFDTVEGGEGTDRLVLDYSSIGSSVWSAGVSYRYYDAAGHEINDPTLADKVFLYAFGQNAPVSDQHGVFYRGIEQFDLTGT